MRNAFQEQLDSIFADLAAMCGQVQTALGRATESLLNGDAGVAEEVISADAEIDQARERVEESSYTVLSTQAPVARDLRILIAALRMVSELERMGDLSVHVAKIARLRVPDQAVPEPLRPMISRMATIAEQMVERVCRIVSERDVAGAKELAVMDEEMDELRRETFREMLSGDWQHGIEPAVDIALLGRYYERIADHAVSVAHRVVFVVTGETTPTHGV